MSPMFGWLLRCLLTQRAPIEIFLFTQLFLHNSLHHKKLSASLAHSTHNKLLNNRQHRTTPRRERKVDEITIVSNNIYHISLGHSIEAQYCNHN